MLALDWHKNNVKNALTTSTLLFTPLQTKMSLQLYQVDQKSFLLDFKSLTDADEAKNQDGIQTSPSLVSQGSQASCDLGTRNSYMWRAHRETIVSAYSYVYRYSSFTQNTSNV